MKTQENELPLTDYDGENCSSCGDLLDSTNYGGWCSACEQHFCDTHFNPTVSENVCEECEEEIYNDPNDD